MPDGTAPGQQPAPADAARPDDPGAPAGLAEARDRVREAIAASWSRRPPGRSLLAEAAGLIGAARGGRRDAVPRPEELRADLRASVAAYARVLRSGGLPAERVVVLVKGVVRDATPDGLDAREARGLMEDVVRWSIEAYYAG